MPKWMWKLMWGQWLDEGDKIVKVKGWRTALIDTKKRGRITITPCFWWFN